MKENVYVFFNKDTEAYIFCDKDTKEVCVITNDNQLKECAKIIYKFLLEKGIDFIHDKNGNYRGFKDKVIYLYPNINLTVDDIMQRYFVPDEIKRECYDEKEKYCKLYTLGYPSNDEDDYSLDKFYAHVYDHYTDGSLKFDDFKKIFIRNEYDQYDYEKSGLIKRLIDILDINVNDGDYDNESRCKILFYFFQMERFEKKHIFSMFKVPAIENVDAFHTVKQKTENW